MQAIQTKYFGPGNVRGSRIVAKAAAGSITMPYDHALNVDQNHHMAALRLMEKMKWNSDYYGNLESGTLPDGSYCHVMTGRGPDRIKAALGNLLQWAVGNRGNKQGMPYQFDEVKEGLKALHYAATGYDETEFTKYSGAADSYRTKVEG